MAVKKGKYLANRKGKYLPRMVSRIDSRKRSAVCEEKYSVTGNLSVDMYSFPSVPTVPLFYSFEKEILD